MVHKVSALKPLIAGDVIIDTKAVIHKVYKDFKGKYCDNCLEVSFSLKQCSKCHSMWYCDQSCQHNDWKYHRNECKVFRHRKYKINETDVIESLLIRLWLTIKSDETFVTQSHRLFDGSVISLKDIEINTKRFSKDLEHMFDFIQICCKFQKYGIKFDIKELLHWFEVIRYSATTCPLISFSFEEDVVGHGLFPQLASVCHSCLPNTAIATNGPRLELRAMKSISVGTQITRNYNNSRGQVQNKMMRQLYLERFCLLDYKCIKCEQNLDSNIDYQKFELLSYRQMELRAKLPDKEPLTKKNRSDYRKLLDDLIENTSQMTKCMEKMCDGYHPMVCRNLFVEMSFRVRLAKCTETAVELRYYERVEKHVRITFGTSHPLYILMKRMIPYFNKSHPNQNQLHEEMSGNSLNSRIAGDIIIGTKPVVHIILQQFKSLICDNCIKESNSLKKCTKCKQMFYCDKTCQRIDWKYHKNECSVFANKNFKPKETNWSERLLIRLWLTIKTDETFITKRYQTFDGLDISFKDIEIDLKEFSVDIDRLIHYHLISNHFTDCGIKYNNKELLRWLAVITCSPIRCNLFKDFQRLTLVGFGLFPQMASVRHSCLPNSAVITNGLSLELRAIKPIAVGTQITRNYVSLMQKKSKRQSELKKEFLIDCKCDKCEQNMDSKIDYEQFNGLISRQSSLCAEICLSKLQNDRSSHYKGLLEDSIKNTSNIKRFIQENYGKYHPVVLRALLTELSFREHLSELTQTELNPKYYDRVEEQIRILYSANRPISQCLIGADLIQILNF